MTALIIILALLVAYVVVRYAVNVAREKEAERHNPRIIIPDTRDWRHLR